MCPLPKSVCMCVSSKDQALPTPSPPFLSLYRSICSLSKHPGVHCGRHGLDELPLQACSFSQATRKQPHSAKVHLLFVSLGLYMLPNGRQSPQIE